MIIITAEYKIPFPIFLVQKLLEKHTIMSSNLKNYDCQFWVDFIFFSNRAD
uniref:Uncharacterized protein n=1 Tax=Romanomermis culicivorax TaxID=13658 RepID=A0A915IRK1_ROMCU